MTEPIPHLEIVGPGRAGLALGSRLLEVGAVRRLSYSGRSAFPPDHPLFRGSPPAAGYRGFGAAGADHPDGIILAVPDAAIAEVAAALAAALTEVQLAGGTHASSRAEAHLPGATPAGSPEEAHLPGGTPAASLEEGAGLPRCAFVASRTDARLPGGAPAAPLADAGLARATPVLHLSGALGAEALAPLALRGFPTGSLHPLVAFSDVEAGARLSGAWFAVEGAPAARALAERIVAALGGHLLPLAGEGKAEYHAAAVAASNFVVALLGVAERWMIDAGVPGEPAREALATLASGAVESYRRLGPVEALTGPVSRGDTATVEAHLARLSPSDRPLYSLLASSALTLARQRGLDPGAAAALARLLEPTE